KSIRHHLPRSVNMVLGAPGQGARTMRRQSRTAQVVVVTRYVGRKRAHYAYAIGRKTVGNGQPKRSCYRLIDRRVATMTFLRVASALVVSLAMSIGAGAVHRQDRPPLNGYVIEITFKDNNSMHSPVFGQEFRGKTDFTISPRRILKRADK